MFGPFSIHNVPSDVLNRLHPDVRMDLADTLHALDRIHAAVGGGRTQVAMQLAQANPGRMGWNESSLLRKYYAVLNSGWRGALDGRRAGQTFWQTDEVALPPAFITHWQILCEQNQRKCAPAYAQLIRQWQAWRRGNTKAALPGYTICPEPRTDTGTPDGWSERNLSRYKPTERELVRARVGNKAATESLLPVVTTRVGLEVGQYLVIDDHEFNLKVNFVGQSRAMRPRMLGVLDIASGSLFSYGLKPTIWDETEERKKALTERDTKWLIAHTLINVGYRPAGTVILSEHGLAVIRKDFAERIATVTNNAVTVERSGMVGKRQMPGQYDGKAGGNPRFKTHLESTWNLVDNTFADLPGQTGKNPENCPEQLQGLDHSNTALLKAAATLPPAHAGRLQFDILTWGEFLQAALDRFSAIDTTRDHELEGWEECGHIAKFFRFTPQQEWLPTTSLAHLPPAQAGAVLAAAETLPLRKSRREVFTAGRGAFARVPLAYLADLLGPDFATTVKVRKMTIEIMDRDLGPSSFRYIARFGDRIIEDGTPLTCYLNPHDTDQLVAYDMQGRCVGVAEPLRRVSRTDVSAINWQMGQRKSLEAQLNAQQDQRHAGFAAEHAERRRLNAEILAGRAPATQAELDEKRDEETLVELYGAQAKATILSNPTPSDPQDEIQHSPEAVQAILRPIDQDFGSGDDEPGGFIESLLGAPKTP